ncbi:hypothetical protein BD413DRAFT_531060 [Trametes elegans]|nr:hypothetical protein BD413DRAFT_531060 [Trametes elegans]
MAHSRMSSYSSTSLSGSSSYGHTDASSLYPNSPLTSPGTTPPSPFTLKSPSSPVSLATPNARASRSKPPRGERVQAPRDEQRLGEASIGIDLSMLTGKVLTCVRRSRAHPSLTLHFADGESYQVRVVGYDPHFRGVPKKLESDSPVLNPVSGAVDVELTVKHAAMVTLADKAFQVQSGPSPVKGQRSRESRWTQRHAAFAVKFVEQTGWHCVWATLAEYDEKDREMCVFRNFADVYVDSLHPISASPALPSFPHLHDTHVRTASPRSGTNTPSPKTSKGKSKRKNKNKKKADAPKARW